MIFIAPFNVAAVITSGGRVARVIAIQTGKDTHRPTPGMQVQFIATEVTTGGRCDFIPDHEAGRWRPVPFEWAAVVPASSIEERYVWTNSWTQLRRETRLKPGTVMPTVNGIRGHRVTTAEEDKVREALMLAAGSITAEDTARLLAELAEDCRSEHGLGHPDCPKCWRWSERNPNRVPRP